MQRSETWSPCTYSVVWGTDGTVAILPGTCTTTTSFLDRGYEYDNVTVRLRHVWIVVKLLTLSLTKKKLVYLEVKYL